MKTTRVPWVLLPLVLAVACGPAFGQRMQFPTTLPSADSGAYPAQPGPAPAAVLEGGIQSPSADWDPYATYGDTAPPSLLPEDPYFQYGGPATISGTFTTMRRFLDEVRMDYVWMPGTTVEEFGISDVELSATFAIPFLYNTDTPLLVTPGFAFHWWNGPAAAGFDLPARAFDAYLDAAWNPQVTPWLGGELAVRVGVYSDFHKVVDDSVRFPCSGLAVLTFSPSFQVKAGVVYLDRHPVKILPAGGIIWTPNSDVRFEILFPNPKAAKRLTTIGNTEWWGYIRGEYGGGTWTVDRVVTPLNPAPDNPDLVGYNDLRFSVGVDFTRLNGLAGLFEAGVAFERQVRYRSLAPAPGIFYPNTTLFLRGGLSY